MALDGKNAKETDHSSGIISSDSDLDSAVYEEPGQSEGGENPSTSIIILAAGNSSRMGQSKQLMVIDGKPLLVNTINAAAQSGARDVIVMLGANEDAHRQIIGDLSVDIVTNHYWKNGIGSTIKTGMNYLLRTRAETSSVIIMVSDQPSISGDHLQKIIALHRQENLPIVASSYGGTNGVPALFARSFFSNILMLKDEEGAKKIIQQFPQQLKTVDFPNGIYDLDTREDYENYLNQQ